MTQIRGHHRRTSWQLVILGCLCVAPGRPGHARERPPDKAIALEQASKLEQQAKAHSKNLPVAELLLLRAVSLRQEWLGPAHRDLVGILGALAARYAQHARWDEHSVIRARMLELWATTAPGPRGLPPGGPFSRIGIPGYDSEKRKPPTRLSRWLNRRLLPELYVTPEPRFAALRDSFLRGIETSAESVERARRLERLGALLASHTRFQDAKRRYREAAEMRDRLASRGDAAHVDCLVSLALLGELRGETAEADAAFRAARALTLPGSTLRRTVEAELAATRKLRIQSRLK